LKLLSEDTRFSKYIRDRDNWRCQRCWTKYEEGSRSLQCSHFWSRKRWTTRFDPRNCDTLCCGCHRLWEDEKQGDYAAFKKKQLGEAEYKKLEIMAYSTSKKSTELLKASLWLKSKGY